MKFDFKIPALALFGCVALAMPTASARAQMVYVSTLNAEFGTLDVTTGVFTQIAITSTQLSGLALTPSGTPTLYALDSNVTPDLYTVNTSTGALTDLGSTGISQPANSNNSLTFKGDGTLYAIDGTSNLYTVNKSTGAATEVGPIGNVSQGGIAYNGNLYEVDTSTNNLDIINQTTGAGTPIGPIGFSQVYGLVDVGGTVYGFTANDQIITINTTTGAGTLTGSYSLPGQGVDYIYAATNTSATPEPGVYALAASLGLTGAAFLRRRRAR